MTTLTILLYLLAAFGTGLHVMWIDWHYGMLVADRFTFGNVIVLSVLWPLTLAIWFGLFD